METAERALSDIGKIGGLGENHQAGMYWLTSLDLPWMLVIDNADDPFVDYSRFFPSGDKGHILVTSRLQDCKIHATIGYHEFRNMEEEDAVTLLLRAADESVDLQESRETAKPIVRALGYLPLALTQAGASIRQKICTLEDYLEVYDSHSSDLMKRRLAQSTDSYQHSIYTTWEVTVRRIEEESSEIATDAVQILQIIAFLHFEQIPVSIFERAWSNLHQRPESLPPEAIASKIYNHISRVPCIANSVRSFFPRWLMKRQRRLPPLILIHGTSWDSFRFRAALVMLEKHSLIYRDSGQDQTYSMHPMVHSWARERLQEPEQNLWSDLAMNTLATSITLDLELKFQRYRIALIPHINACLKGKYSSTLLKGIESDYQISKSIKFASVYSEGGDWKTASLIQERVVEINRSAMRTPGPDLLDVKMALANSYWNLGRMIQCLELLSEVVRESTSSLGGDDTKTLRAKDKLAGSLWLCGQRKKARVLSEEAVNGFRTHLKPNHPYTLDAMDTLGRTLLHLGLAGEAVELHQEVLEGRRKLLGSSHPDTLMAMANLGMAYHARKDYAQAEDLLDLVFRERSRILGEEHAYTLWAVNDLSKIRCDMGRPVEAEGMLMGILDTVVRTLGKEHIGMLMTQYNLAYAYGAQERWADSKRVLLELIEVQKKKGFAEHPDRITAELELARAMKQLGQLDEAELMLKDVIVMARKVHGPDDAGTMHAMGQLAAIYITKGQFEEADRIEAKLRQSPSLNA